MDKRSLKSVSFLTIIFFLVFSQKISIYLWSSYFKIVYFILPVWYISILIKSLILKKHPTVKPFEVVFLILLVYLGINVLLFSEDIILKLKYLSLMVMSAIFYLSIKCYGKITKLDFETLLECFSKANLLFVIGSLIYFMIGIIHPVSYGSSYGAFYSEGIIRLEGLTFNPVFYGLYISPYYFILLTDIVNLKKKKLTPFILVIISLLLTVSKAPILINLIITLAYLTLTIFRQRRIKLSTAVHIHLWPSLLLSIYMFIPVVRNFINFIIVNRVDDLIKSQGSGRTFIWNNAYYEFININPVFGRGFFTPINLNGVQLVIHNTFLEYLFNTGIIGFAIFIVLVLMISKEIIGLPSDSNKHLLLLSLLSIIFQINFVTATYHEVLFTIPLLLVFLKTSISQSPNCYTLKSDTSLIK